MEINNLIKILEDKLKKNCVINNLKIEDKSFLHKKHQHFDKEKFHIKLIIESSELKSMSRVGANKKIYNILKDEMKKKIHSLQIIIV